MFLPKTDGEFVVFCKKWFGANLNHRHRALETNPMTSKVLSILQENPRDNCSNIHVFYKIRQLFDPNAYFC